MTCVDTSTWSPRSGPVVSPDRVPVRSPPYIFRIGIRERRRATGEGPWRIENSKNEAGATVAWLGHDEVTWLLGACIIVPGYENYEL